MYKYGEKADSIQASIVDKNISKPIDKNTIL
jgi:hypothetical protein